MLKKMIVDSFLKNNWKTYVVGILALISSSLMAIALPKLLGYIVDSMTDRTKTLDEVILLALFMLILAVLLFGLKYIYRTLIIGKSRDLECFLRESLFLHFQNLSPGYFNTKKTGDLMAYAINDLGSIRMAFAMGLTFLIDGLLINLFSVFIMTQTISPLLTLITVGPVFLSIIVILKLRKAIRDKYTVVQNAFAELSGKIQENITGIRVVKAYVQEESETQSLKTASLRRYKVQMDYVKLSSFLQPLTSISFGISFTILLTVGAVMVKNSTISLGDFIAMNAYLQLLVMPINNLGRIVAIWQRALASMNRINDVFVSKPDIFDDETIITNKQEIKGDIDINGLSFAYGEKLKPALSDINLHIKAGQTIGIIGKTGSGKTTIANLLLRLYRTKNDLIKIDGVDINRIPLTSLRRSIGYVPQDNFLFAATIDTNIKFFDEMIQNESVLDATKLACVYENILEFPEQFETIIGERGITLSGGQKQRLSIARAVVKNPSILILDDALSAVDTDTEEKILKNLKLILNGKTGIIITHRVSSVKNADNIVVLDEGRIIEQGTHDELIALGGEYFKLSKIQTLQGDLDRQEANEHEN